MANHLTPAEQAAVKAPNIMPFFAIEADYPDGMVRACTLDRDLMIVSPSTGVAEKFTGVGILGALSDIEEGSENRSYGFTVTMSGIPFEFADYLLQQDPHGRKIYVISGLIDPLYNVIVRRVITRARMDAQDLQPGDNIGVVLNCESAAVDWERARIRRCTDADHRARHPNDGFFKYIAAMENMNLTWGRA